VLGEPRAVIPAWAPPADYQLPPGAHNYFNGQAAQTNYRNDSVMAELPPPLYESDRPLTVMDRGESKSSSDGDHDYRYGADELDEGETSKRRLPGQPANDLVTLPLGLEVLARENGSRHACRGVISDAYRADDGSCLYSVQLRDGSEFCSVPTRHIRVLDPNYAQQLPEYRVPRHGQGRAASARFDVGHHVKTPHRGFYRHGRVLDVRWDEQSGGYLYDVQLDGPGNVRERGLPEARVFDRGEDPSRIRNDHRRRVSLSSKDSRYESDGSDGFEDVSTLFNPVVQHAVPQRHPAHLRFGSPPEMMSRRYEDRSHERRRTLPSSHHRIARDADGNHLSIGDEVEVCRV
jgi:hypothetical protein